LFLLIDFERSVKLDLLRLLVIKFIIILLEGIHINFFWFHLFIINITLTIIIILYYFLFHFFIICFTHLLAYWAFRWIDRTLLHFFDSYIILFVHACL